MSVGSARTLIPVLAILAFAAALGWYFSRERAPAPQVPPGPPATAGAPSAPAEAQLAQPAPTPSVTAPQQSAALPSPADVARPAQPGPAGSDQARAADQPKQAGAAEDPKLPSFDVVRVEPTGESVIAGRASPGATVELLRNGQSFARVIADASGLFAFVPPPLPPGSHEVVLQANTPDGGGRARSAQSVTVVIAGDRKQTPLVTVTAPDQPTIILSRPDEPSAAPAGKPPAGPAVAPAAPAVASAAKPEATPARPEAQPAPAKRPEIRIATVEAEGTGRLFVSGQAAPGATIRLYLNDAFVAPSGTGPDGRLSFSIERGIRPGDYRVRLDDVDPVTGAVKSRAEVPFTVPAPPPVAVAGAPVGRPTDAAGSTSRPSARTPDATAAPADRASPAGPVIAGVQPAAPASTVPSTPASPGERSAAAGGAIVLADPGQVVVPEVNTAIVARGDNLWRISKRVYGQGLRYTVIYGANTPQIRNPDLIYPGQVFVLPADSAQTR